jgi:hypothetical protein
MTDRRTGDRSRLSRAAAPSLCAAMLAAGGCTHTVKVEPIRIEPIYVTLDVRLKVDRELDSFFDFEDKAAPSPEDSASPKGAGS